MAEIIYNEEERLSELLKHGFRTDATYDELALLAKYYRISFGYGKANIYKSLVSFLKEKGFEDNVYVLDEILHKISSRAIKQDGFKMNSYPINITDNEIERIRRVKNFKYQQLIFSAMVFSKSFGNPRIFSENSKTISHIIKMSGQRVSIDEFNSLVSYLANVNEIFRFHSKRYKYYIFYEIDDGVPTISIDNDMSYMNAGKVYESYTGGELLWCDCGEEFLRSGRNNRYCPSCSEERRRLRQRETMRKRRS